MFLLVVGREIVVGGGAMLRMEGLLVVRMGFTAVLVCLGLSD